MTFTRPISTFQSPTFRPNAKIVLTGCIRFRVCDLEFLFALRTFLFLLYSCQSAASLRLQGLFLGKKQAVLRDSLHILARIKNFVKHFSRFFSTFFRIFSRIFRAVHALSFPTLYIVCTRAGAHIPYVCSRPPAPFLRPYAHRFRARFCVPCAPRLARGPLFRRRRICFPRSVRA